MEWMESHLYPYLKKISIVPSHVGWRNEQLWALLIKVANQTPYHADFRRAIHEMPHQIRGAHIMNCSCLLKIDKDPKCQPSHKDKSHLEWYKVLLKREKFIRAYSNQSKPCASVDVNIPMICKVEFILNMGVEIMGHVWPELSKYQVKTLLKVCIPSHGMVARSITMRNPTKAYRKVSI